MNERSFLARLKKRFSPVIPRWEKMPEAASDVHLAAAGDDVIDRAMDWWKHDSFTRVPRHQRLRWLGVTLSTRTLYRTIRGDYWRPASDTVALIEDMQRAGIVPALTASSTIFESGCSVGRNLYYLQDRFGCEVVGLDISEGAVEQRNEIWRQRSRYRFLVDNALTTSFLDSCPDAAFDLVLTRGHLMHVPRSEAKRRYVASLKRIAKVLVIIEPVRPGVHDVQLYHDGTYTLSWDDWASEYALTEYRSPTGLSMGADTGVFYAAGGA